MASQGKKVWVNVPVSDAWLAKRRRSAIIGWGLLGGGIGCFILSRQFSLYDPGNGPGYAGLDVLDIIERTFVRLGPYVLIR